MNTKKVIAILLALVLTCAVSVGITLAWLTDRDTVTNVFTVGDVQIKLDETDTDEDGQPIPDDEGNTVRKEEGNEYHLIPGQTYQKDPMVTVEAKSEPSYIRMMVTINRVAELKAIFGEDFLPENYVSGWDSNIWPCVGMTDNGDNTMTLEFRYHRVVDEAKASDTDVALEPLFTHFTVPGEVTGEQLATLYPQTPEDTQYGFQITVEGHAIQSATFANADEAWAAFDAQYGKTNP